MQLRWERTSDFIIHVCHFQAEFFAVPAPQKAPTVPRGAQTMIPRSVTLKAMQRPKERLRESPTDGDIMRGGLSFFVCFGEFSVALNLAGNLFLNFTGLRQRKVVRRQLG